MDFTEKLARLTSERSKTRLSEKAELPSTAISNYITKKQIPRADKAVAIAKALEVPVEWLIDDSQSWPPPDRPANVERAVSTLSDDELMLEVSRRLRSQEILLVDLLDGAEKTDWSKIKRELEAVEDDQPMPPSVRDIVHLLIGLYFVPHQTAYHYNPHHFALQHHAQMPGASRSPDEFDQAKIVQRMTALLGNEGFRYAQNRFLNRVPMIANAEFDVILEGFARDKALAPIADKLTSKVAPAERARSRRSR